MAAAETQALQCHPDCCRRRCRAIGTDCLGGRRRASRNGIGIRVPVGIGGWEGASDRARWEIVLNRVLGVCGRSRTRNARRPGLRPSPTSAFRRRHPATAGLLPPSPDAGRIAKRDGGPGMLGGSSCLPPRGQRAPRACAGLSAAVGCGLGWAGVGLGVVARALMLGTSEPTRIAPAAKIAAATQNAVV
jgi:hypothetical protein